MQRNDVGTACPAPATTWGPADKPSAPRAHGAAGVQCWGSSGHPVCGIWTSEGGDSPGLSWRVRGKALMRLRAHTPLLGEHVRLSTLPGEAASGPHSLCFPYKVGRGAWICHRCRGLRHADAVTPPAGVLASREHPEGSDLHPGTQQARSRGAQLLELLLRRGRESVCGQEGRTWPGEQARAASPAGARDSRSHFLRGM